jgi:hypothetical protein
MRLPRSLVWLSIGASLVAGGVQCSSSSSAPPGGTGTGGGGGNFDAGLQDQVAVDSPGQVDSPPPPPDGDTLGGLTVDDIPDVPCIPNGGATVTLYAADAGTTTPLSRMSQVNGRRVAGGIDAYGVELFDLSGANPGSLIASLGTGLIEFSVEGTTFGVAGNTATDVFFQRYNSSGATQGSQVTLATGLPQHPSGVSIGSGDGQSLVVWGDGGNISAQAVDSNGNAVGSSFTVATRAYATLLYSSVAYAGNGVWGIAWTGDVPLGGGGGLYGTVSAVALANTSGVTAGPNTLTTTQFVFEVYKIIHTPSGYAMLVAQAIHDGIYVILLDNSGNVSGHVKRYIGADIAWDIVAQGNEMGLVVERQLDNDEVDAGGPGVDAANDADLDLQPYQLRFRPLADDGSVLGPWVCIGQDVPSNSAFQDMAIDLDPGGGYAVASRSPAGDELLTIFNHLGQ